MADLTLHRLPFTLEHIDVGAGYWMVVDARGVPVAQGSRELCQGVIDRSRVTTSPKSDRPGERPQEPQESPVARAGEQLDLF